MNQPTIIDIHSHILPALDDGSENVETSLAMLRTMKQQGVDICVATPHYYGHHHSVASFLERRDRSWQSLKNHLDESMPQVVLGAEVAASDRLLKAPDLDRLCLAESNTLLLEMPFSQWTDEDLDLVSTLCLDRGLTILLAHLERFYPLQHNKDIFYRILALPLYAQVNAESFLSLRTRRGALSLFADGYAQVLGSDAHNLKDRAPNLNKGRKSLQKHLGSDVLDQADCLANELVFPEAKP